MSSIKIGNLAPTFKLKDQNGNIVDLKSFKDKKIVVLYFYPRAMTPGCTVQACGIRDHKKQMEKLNTVVFGISPDKETSLVKFVERDQLNFTLLSDPEHTVAEKYGAWGEKSLYGKKYMGILRKTYIIGIDGKLKTIFEKVNTKTHHDDVMSFISSNL